MARHGVRVVRAFAGLAAALALGACGGGPSTLAAADVEAAVADAVGSGLAVEVATVSCPDEVPIEIGRRTTCRVEVDGLGEMEAIVVQVDDQGTLEVALGSALIDREEVATSLRSTLREELGRSFQVDCGDDPPALVEVGDTFPCRARDADSRRSVDVTVEGADGAVSFEILRPGA